MDGIVEELELKSTSCSKWKRIRNKFKNEIKGIASKKAAESDEQIIVKMMKGKQVHIRLNAHQTRG